jgi:large subunit ribosomal protein L18
MKSRNEMRLRRHERVRRGMSGTPGRPRLNVFRSLAHIYAQIVDDTQGRTLVSASTVDGELRAELATLDKTEQARRVGAALAKRALAAGLRQVVFDRGGYRYHGRIKALADASREAGLEF